MKWRPYYQTFLMMSFCVFWRSCCLTGRRCLSTKVNIFIHILSPIRSSVGDVLLFPLCCGSHLCCSVDRILADPWCWPRPRTSSHTIEIFANFGIISGWILASLNSAFCELTHWEFSWIFPVSCWPRQLVSQLDRDLIQSWTGQGVTQRRNQRSWEGETLKPSSHYRMQKILNDFEIRLYHTQIIVPKILNIHALQHFI